MIIGLTGYARSGKDSVAQILVDNYGFTKYAFADKVRDIAYELNPIVEHSHKQLYVVKPVPLQSIVDALSWEHAKSTVPEVRRLLQDLGMAVRKHLGEETWIRATLDQIDKDKNVVISDVRFSNEAEAISALGGQVWRIKRMGVDAVNSHISETQMDGYKVDQILLNHGTLEDLELSVKTRMNGLL